MIWLETTTDEEATTRSADMWTPTLRGPQNGRVVGTVQGPNSERGKFWADAIKDVRDDPLARLTIARRHLPLPAAFRELALALRAMIRKARKDGAEYEPWLRELHHFAAISSWALPYNEIAQEPGFNVLERTPYARLAALDLRWEVVGCDELPILNKTDRALMRRLWGVPHQHTTANALYRDLWLEGCREVATNRLRPIEGPRDFSVRMEEHQARGTPKLSLLARLIGRR